MTHILQDLSQFLSDSPTSWHAAREMGNRLASVDFTPLSLKEKWTLENGKKYFVIHEGTIIAFALPTEKLEKMSLVAAHTDSPALKLKPSPEVENHNALYLGFEVYGSPILSSWTNRDLAIAGRVIVDKGKGNIEEDLVFFDDAPLLIPLLAPHLDREAYQKGSKLNPQDQLLPIATLTDQPFNGYYLESLLRRHLTFQKLLDYDLFLVPLEAPRFLGASGELLASYRLDNLGSAHAALVALGYLDTPPKTSLPIGIFWDHEEIGSSTSTGAESPLFRDIYKRIIKHYKITSEEEAILRQNSICLSVDMTHAVNANYEKKHDPYHLPLLGGGVVIKYNANMRYSTNAKTGAFVGELCQKVNLKSQKFVNRADNAAGSTVGPIFSTQFGVATADIGIAQLSMHAARELINCQDHIDLCALLTQFLQEGS